MRPSTSHLKTAYRIWYMTKTPRSTGPSDTNHGPRPRSKDPETLLQTRVWS